MNFYKRFVGDIQAKTGHLSLAEFGAYDRLLDHYYSTERGLPGDLDRCCGIARAMTKDDRKAVQFVLMEFFHLRDDGLYIQGRTEEMIAEAQPKIEAARTNGAKGGRPKNNPTRTQQEPNGLIKETQHKPNTKASQSQSQKNTEIPEAALLVASACAEAPDSVVVKLPDRRIPCPSDRLLEAFHTECPTLPRVMKLNDKRRTHLTARWREVDADSKFQNPDDGIEIFRTIFKRVNASDFLAGRAKSWHATFDWLTDSSTNFLKVCEGHYDNDMRVSK